MPSFLSEAHLAFSSWIMSESGLKLLANMGEFKQLRDRAISAITPVNLLAGDDLRSAADHLLSAVVAAIDEGANRISQAGLMRKQPIDSQEKERHSTDFIQKRTAFERSAREKLEIT